MEKVIIKCFKTPVAKCFYDRHLDTVVAVNDEEYETLKEIEKTGKVLENNGLNRFVKNGLLSPTIIKEIEHPDTAILQLLSEDYIWNLILQVTQQCNLRCKYCAYSGNYFNREHSVKRMSFDIAKRAIDFYLERSKKANELCLSFYGGAPLLEFELIKKCVRYIMDKRGEKVVRFPITTNGTLLTDEVIRFLVQYDVDLMISLDGDKESHDANRLFKTGKGSFDVILSNLRKLKEYNPIYYAEKVSFNCVISSTSNMENIYKFYSEHDLFDPRRVSFNYVNTTNIKDESISHITDKNFKINTLEHLKMTLSLLGKRKWDDLGRSLRANIADVELLYEQLHRHTSETEKLHHGGPCIPGVRRLFVETDGTFFPCERVSEEDKEMSIGSLDTGFDYSKMDFFLNHGKMLKEECLSCWNLRICSYCLSNITKENQKLTREILLKECENSKRKSLLTLYKMCILVELGYRGDENFNVYR